MCIVHVVKHIQRGLKENIKLLVCNSCLLACHHTYILVSTLPFSSESAIYTCEYIRYRGWYEMYQLHLQPSSIGQV